MQTKKSLSLFGSTSFFISLNLSKNNSFQMDFLKHINFVEFVGSPMTFVL